MKTFSEFITEKQLTNKGYYVDKKGNVVIVGSIGLRKEHLLREFTENLPDQHKRSKDLGYLENNKKEHAHYKKISKQLHSVQQPLTPEEKKHVRSYTEYSGELTKKLVHNHKHGLPDDHGLTSHGVKSDKDLHPAVHSYVHKDEKEIHQTIKKVASRPIGKEVHLYSGVGFDPKEAAKKSNGIFHTPAHLSTSHEAEIAREFAHDHRGDGEAHIMHIHAKPSDKGYHVGARYSSRGNSHQNETILPAGTSFKYSHSDKLEDGTNVHHFTIHHQE